MTVKIKKHELLDVVKKNRDEHKEIVAEAFQKYRELAVAELDKMLEEAKSGKRIRRSVGLVEPMDQTPEYNKAIRQIEMSAEDVIELNDHEFSQLCLNQWVWQKQFLHSNRGYSQKAAEIESAGEN